MQPRQADHWKPTTHIQSELGRPTVCPAGHSTRAPINESRNNRVPHADKLATRETMMITTINSSLKISPFWQLRFFRSRQSH